jgi:alpha-ketoglutarate-dependent taurine dioxygenase
MKISKIPGLGRFGVFIDDVDFKNLSDEEWREIGKIHITSLVTILRNVKNLTKDNYKDWIKKWGTDRDLTQYRLEKKYNAFYNQLMQRALDNDAALDESDKFLILSTAHMSHKDQQGRPTSVLQVTGKRDNQGNPLGMFAEGELLWHSNESGNLCFTPAVSLLGGEGMVGSATGFVTTTDWYERQTESFRSELDEMIVVHKFTPGRINPGLRAEQDFVMYKNMCPEDGVEIPLIIQSPAGIRGLHYSVNTIDSIKGMSQQQSQELFERIDRELFTEEFIYDHWYQQNNDLCLFDNSITLHRRLGGITERMAYRIQYDYDEILDQPYVPYSQEPFRTQYIEQINDVMSTLNKKRFKLPVLN